MGLGEVCGHWGSFVVLGSVCNTAALKKTSRHACAALKFRLSTAHCSASL